MVSKVYKSNARSSPVKVLKRIIDNNMSGRLVFKDAQNSGGYWEICVGKGQLHFACATQNTLEPLRYCTNLDIDRFDWTNVPEMGAYELICHFWRSKALTLQEVRQLVLKLTQDALTQILASPQVDVQFEKGIGLDPILLDVSIQSAITSCKQQILGWRNLRPTIQSPLQRLTHVNIERFANCLDGHIEQPSSPSGIESLLADEPTFYRLADRCNVNVLDLATLAKPLIERGDIVLENLDKKGDVPQLTIACIDDSRAVQRKVRLTLESAGYKVLELMEPARALTALVRAKPSVILLDITMPELNGYDLCRMFRQSAALKGVPIVMLTGRDGAIDRLRARMAGSTDYMTKPFNSQVLLSRIQELTAS